MSLSNNALFTNSIQQISQPSILWSLTPGSGEKTVYAKFYTLNGTPSQTVFDTITVVDQYNDIPVEEIKQEPTEPTLPEPESTQTPVAPTLPLFASSYPPGIGPYANREGAATSPTVKPAPDKFTKLLSSGTVHEEVRYLQQLLNRQGILVAKSGVGSPGRETNYFGTLTKKAVIRFQQIHNLQQTGIVSAADRVVLNSLWDKVSVQQPVPQTALKMSSQTFTRTLTSGSRGEDVKLLQVWLNANGFTVSTQGAGSPGHETDLYGSATHKAVMKLQQKYADEILKPLGLRYPTGTFAGRTKEFVNQRLESIK